VIPVTCFFNCSIKVFWLPQELDAIDRHMFGHTSIESVYVENLSNRMISRGTHLVGQANSEAL
jgi:hypothetical protein